MFLICSLQNMSNKEVVFNIIDGNCFEVIIKFRYNYMPPIKSIKFSVRDPQNFRCVGNKGQDFGKVEEPQCQGHLFEIKS